ncbi:MAG: cytochrome c biogenesis protein CcsA [Pseudomonadales bacterium]|nr:cytochrome c biogenesis protein CcsA [Pseudomonadales bacterium]
MYASTSGLIAIIFYFLGSFYQIRTITGSQSYRRQVRLYGSIAVLAHLFNVYWVIKTPLGYDFGFFRIITLFSWAIAALVLLSSLKKPLENLFLALFPLAIISIALSLSLDSDYPIQADYTAGVASHILLAILATSSITIAAFQASFIAYQNHQLKHRHSSHLIRQLPPLQTMEALLFEILWVGLLLLSGVIVTGVLFMEDFFAQHLIHKTTFSMLAWLVFAVLLWGRHRLGWRGNTAIRWTLTGFGFLILAYFGSKFVLEIILNRV